MLGALLAMFSSLLIVLSSVLTVVGDPGTRLLRLVLLAVAMPLFAAGATLFIVYFRSRR
ncbi:hypothetical protein ACWDRB_63560 [Nonomuraea sp. NPDC003707]